MPKTSGTGNERYDLRPLLMIFTLVTVVDILLLADGDHPNPMDGTMQAFACIDMVGIVGILSIMEFRRLR